MQPTVIEAGASTGHYYRELWRYRELFYFLAWRDFLARYKQTAIGVLWAVIRPLITTFVFTLVFSKLARLDSGPVPYLLLVLAAQLPWQLISNALSGCGTSVVSNGHLISKIYFPRLILPLSAILLGLIDFLITLALLLVFMLFYQYYPSWRLLWLPVWVVAALGSALSVGVWIAALSVRYRDFGHLIPFGLQLGIYLSPVGYSTQVVPEHWRFLYSLNPAVGVIEGFRWSLLGTPFQANPTAVVISWVGCLILTMSGLRYFRRIEQSFADTI